MSDSSTHQEQQYMQVLHDYVAALERGDIETVAAILHQAEQDSLLERSLLATNSTYQKNKHIPIRSDEVKQAHAVLLNAFSPSKSEVINIQEDRKQPMQMQQKLLQQEKPSPLYSSVPTRIRRFSALAQTLVAVLVVGLIVSGFAALFASRHQTTTSSGLAGTPHTVLSRSIVVASTDDGIVYGVRPDTGSIAWHYTTGKSTINGSSTLTVQGQVVYFAAKGQLYALRATNGTLLWHKNLDVPKAVFINYTKIVVERGIVLVSGQADGTGLSGGILYALRGRDGAELWSYQKGGASPLRAVHNGIVYVENLVDDNGHLAIQALKVNDGSVLWSYTTQVMAVVANDTTVYVYSAHPLNVPGEIPPGIKKQNKTLLALNMKGTLLWSRPVVDDGINTLVMAQGVLIVGEIDGKTYHVCGYRTTNGAQAWCAPNEPALFAAGTHLYAVSGNTFYSSSPVMSSGSDTLLIDAYNVSNGNLRWSTRIVENFAAGTLLAMDKTVYMVGYHKVYAIDGANGRVHWLLLNSAATFTFIAAGSW